MFTIGSCFGRSAALVLTASLAIPTVTQAQTLLKPEIVVRRVPIGNLDLAKPTDVRLLRHRVARAISGMCGVASQADLLGDALIDKCRRTAALSAEPQIAARIQRDTAYALARNARAVG